ncbi:MAG: cyclic nucleotide-binding domain-containing protein [Myxococcales bacterium]|nr:cyclic nucleotide-binding domain-containing protein [Myxococcales bacterium]MCB9537057.1 cyclic nucleotide-binding domain-containing protein [Myxococcales bacterium]
MKRGISQWLTPEDAQRAAKATQDGADTLVTEDPEGRGRPVDDTGGPINVTERFDDRGEIGRGGMSTVRRVFDRSLLRDSALKVLDPRFGRADDRVWRFVEEGRVTGQLEHPSIVPVHELGRDEDGVHYICMKLVQGRTLEELLEGPDAHRLQPERLGELLRVFVKVCEAIAFAHDRGVIHRDIKPANIMVGAFGQVYLMDWGVARLLPGSRAADSVRAPHEQTPETDERPGDVIGTPHYMAPEQARGLHDQVDTRTDVFALGATLYHILTGRPPYGGRTVFQVLMAATRRRLTPPEEVVTEGKVPPALARICMRAMAIDPADRYPDALALQRAIERFVQGSWHLPTRAFPAGTAIVRQGEEGDAAYIITAGTCAVYRELESGGRQFIRDLGPGEVFGETAVFSAKPRTATVEAQDDVTAMVVTRDTLVDTIGLNSWVGTFVKALAERFREVDGRLRELEAAQGSTGDTEDGGPR